MYRSYNSAARNAFRHFHVSLGDATEDPAARLFAWDFCAF
jgi:hypothetical protein